MPLPTTGRHNLYREDGSRRAEEDVWREFGPIGYRLSLLDDAVHRRVSNLETEINYPPRLFLAYKWGTETHNGWVRDLARKLTSRGWDVVVDAFRDETVDRSVEDFVSRIITCRVFAAVITPAYMESAVDTRRPTWVFDELQVALLASEHIRLLTLWCEGDKLPPFPLIIDLRGEDDAGIEALLDDHLNYDGPTLDAGECTRLRSLLEHIRADEEIALNHVPRLREELARYPFVHAIWRTLVCILRDNDKVQDALQAAEEAIHHVHPWDQRVGFERERIVLLERLGRKRECLQAACELISVHTLDWYGHFQIGNQLDDAGDLWAARNHLRIACGQPNASPVAYNTLGVVYSPTSKVG